jgi:hypothetical protein
VAKRTTRVGKALQAVADFIRPAKKKSAKKKTAKKRPLKKSAQKIVPGAKKKQARRAK